MPAGAAAAGLLLAVVTIGAALLLRGEPTTRPRVATETTSDGATTEQAPPPTPKSARASTVELEQAKKEGVAALDKLHETYPADPVVVQALMLAQGATAEGLPAAVDLAEQLFRMRPAAVREEAVVRFVFKAANASDAVANKAFELMSKRMASQGPDLLYELWIGGGIRASRAEKLLGDPGVRNLATPALRIAVDMRKAEGCKAKGALLERTARDGDERVIVILKPLSTGSRSGCGILGMGACAARCSAQAAKMKQAITAIRARAK
jgi:hypothetical protein